MTQGVTVRSTVCRSFTTNLHRWQPRSQHDFPVVDMYRGHHAMLACTHIYLSAMFLSWILPIKGWLANLTRL